MVERWARRLAPRGLRNLLRDPAATGRWLLDSARGHLGGSAVVRAGGLTIRLHPASARAVRRALRDPAQAAELAAFLAHIGPGARLLDVGASHGLFTLAALLAGGPAARALAVDPSAASNRLLRANLRLNGLAGRVVVVEAAAGAAEGTTRMLTTGPAGDHYLLPSDPRRPDAAEVPMRTLDAIAHEHGFTPTHLKIDIESHEADALRGAARLVAEARPRLSLEWHRAIIAARGGDPAEVAGVLAALGYAPPSSAADLVRLDLDPPG